MLQADLTVQEFASVKTRYLAYDTRLQDVAKERSRQCFEPGPLSSQTFRKLLAGEQPRLTLSEAAWVESLEEPHPPDELAAMAREMLMLGMANTTTDRTDLIPHIAETMPPEQLEAKLRGSEMTLWEYTAVEQAISTLRSS